MMRLYSIFLSGALLFAANGAGFAQDKYQESSKVDDSKPGKYKEKTKINAKDETASYKENTKVDEKKGKVKSTVEGTDENGSYKEKVKSKTKNGKTRTTIEAKEKP